MYLTATANALVYAGEAWDAWAVVQAQWPLLRNAGFLRLGCVGAHVEGNSRARRDQRRRRSGTRLRELFPIGARSVSCLSRPKTPTRSNAPPCSRTRQATAAAIRSALAGARGESGAATRTLTRPATASPLATCPFTAPEPGSNLLRLAGDAAGTAMREAMQVHDGRRASSGPTVWRHFLHFAN